MVLTTSSLPFLFALLPRRSTVSSQTRAGRSRGPARGLRARQPRRLGARGVGAVGGAPRAGHGHGEGDRAAGRAGEGREGDGNKAKLGPKWVWFCVGCEGYRSGWLFGLFVIFVLHFVKC